MTDIVAKSDGRAIVLRLDVANTGQVQDAVRGAEAFGGVEESGEDEIKRRRNVNFFGAVSVIRAALPGMRKRGSGFIVNVSSLAGVRAIIDVMNSPNSPLHLALGADAVGVIAGVCAERAKEIEAWKSFSESTDFQ
jgi:hypothetical protein